MNRLDVTFPSGDGSCAAWLYTPEASGRAPVVVLGHGIGGVKEMRLDAYAERFAAAGYACLAFDYRHFGASSGAPRQLLNVKSELQDWRSAVNHVRARDDVDGSRVILWGSSFGGGLVIDVAAADSGVAAVVSQCPFTNGFASVRVSNPRSLLKVVAEAFRDLFGSALGLEPVLVGLAGPPGSAALMTAPDCEPGYLALTGAAPAFRNEVTARFGLVIARYFPGRRAAKVGCPILFGICSQDTVAPATASLRHAGRAPLGEIKQYPVGHFDVYLGDAFERAVADYVDFLHRHVPVDR